MGPGAVDRILKDFQIDGFIREGPFVYNTMVGTHSTTMRRNDLIEMFLDGQSGEVYADGRLRTVETENGIALVAYHNEVLARVNEQTDDIELYTGHYGQVSQTVTRYIHELGKLLNRRDGFDVTALGGHAPTTGYGRASEAAQFIDQYIGSFADMSGAEEKAFEKVQNALIRELQSDDE